MIRAYLEADQTETSRGRRLISKSPYISRLQRRHFIVFDVAPNLLLVAAIIYSLFWPPHTIELIVCFVMWVITGLGITVGYHRLFTHRAFKAPDAVRTVLAFCGALAGQGPSVSWAAIHRRHHELSDQDGDPHSPNLAGDGFIGHVRGLAHAHYTWMIEHDYPNAAHYVPDLLRDRSILWVNKNYYVIALGGLLAPGLICGLVTLSWQGLISGMLWGGFVRMAVLGHTIWAINSFLHRGGHRPFATPDQSHNAGLAALLTFGESWHNNHHAFPASAKFGLRRGWTDPGWWTICILAKFGLASDIRQPSESQIQQRLRKGQAA
jgi:stearoyl-CoA desaturase (delta-9 desaturase)